MFKFRDLLEMWQMRNDGDNIFAMLQDYRLDERLSRTLMNNQILIRFGTLYPLYNDSDMMKFAIDNWFEEYSPVIDRLLDAQDKFDELDPFVNEDWEENYGGTRNDINANNTTQTNVRNRSDDITDNTTTNATENVTENIDTAKTENTTKTENATKNDTFEEGTTDNKTTDTTRSENRTTEVDTVNTVSAYDSSDYQPQNRTDTDTTDNVDTTENITENNTIRHTSNDTETETRNETEAKNITENVDRDLENTKTQTVGEVIEEEENETDNLNRSDRFTGDRQEKHNLSHRGKSGVQSYADMLEELRDAADFDIYDWVLVRLERAVCLGVY